MDASARHLAFHAAIVLLIGLLCGIPYGRAIIRKAPEQFIHSWRVAHVSLPLGATLMLGVAGILSPLKIEAEVKWVITMALIVSSYAFCISLPLAAIVGNRGLSFQGAPVARLIFIGNSLGAWTSIIAAIVLVYAGFASL